MSSQHKFPGLVILTGDDGEFLGILSFVLNSEGFRTLSAIGDAALESLLQQEPPQLVVLDTFDGLSRVGVAVEGVRRHTQGPIIILATQQDFPAVRHAYGSEQVDVIPKPFPMKDLLTRMTARLEAGLNKKGGGLPSAPPLT